MVTEVSVSLNGRKGCRICIYLESRKLLPWNNVYENSDKRETKKQHQKAVATWRKDLLLLGFEAVFEPCPGGFKVFPNHQSI